MFFSEECFLLFGSIFTHSHVLTQCGSLKGNVPLLLEYVIPKTVERDGGAIRASWLTFLPPCPASCSCVPNPSITLLPGASDYEANSRSPLSSLDPSLLLAIAVLF